MHGIGFGFGPTWPAQTRIAPGFGFAIFPSGSDLGFNVIPKPGSEHPLNPGHALDYDLRV
jgi:hypothetical protein